MLSILTTVALIVIGVLLFELVIFIHEFGHFITAKKSGVKVNEFALGMGPRLFGFTKGETTYSFRLFPIGGYCAMEGEDEDSENPRAFNNAKVWKRMIIIIAGAVMNILLGLVLMFVTLIPKDTYTSTEVYGPRVISFTFVTGLQPGDKIVRMNGYDINTYTDFAFALYTLPISNVESDELKIYKEDCLFDLYLYASSFYEKLTPELSGTFNRLLIEVQPELAQAETKAQAHRIFRHYYQHIADLMGDEVNGYPVIEYRENRQRYRTDMTVIRDGERVELDDVDFLTLLDNGQAKLSMDFLFIGKDMTFGDKITQTFTETISNVRMVWGSLAGLVTGTISFNEMSGPIGIASAITNVASDQLESSGFGSAVLSIVMVMMLITVNLGIINMLPFPALDGGRFLMLLIEAIFKKPVPRNVERIINLVGLVLLLGLSAVVAVMDIKKLIGI